MHKAYELIKEEELGSLQAKGYVLRHKKSGAHVALIKNDDDNKVFYIGFRTPPKDSTGVPHIIEHSVLCGSDKYPLKDPFVELVKGSLNTFLNAMTYPDKTVYPVASCNDKDFANLMDVYMDAVFHPDIYRHPEIFQQEGWHYELPSPEDELTLNGVVYNEMKGAFSSPESVLDRTVLNSLFPDTPYAYESGGDPKDIPKLTYEEFLDFHRTYYHPSNAYIYLYGDMDMEERLDYLDREYLGAYDSMEVDSEIALQPPFEKPIRLEKEYPLSMEEDDANQTYLSCSFVVGTTLDQELYQAFEVLDYALLNSPGAPLRKALLDKGVGKDILGSYDNGTQQPFFSIVAKGANPEDEKVFVETIRQVLEEQVKNGIDRHALKAGVNAAQFWFREGDYGSYPKGLILGLQCMDSWLYDAGQPFLHLHGIEVLDRLREKISTGYFEELVEKYLLHNTHSALIVVTPKKGLTSQEEEQLKAQLQKKKDNLSEEELQQMARQTKHLKEYQQEPTPKEALEKLPMLKREDLNPKIRPLDLQKATLGTIPLLRHKVFTNGIHYLNLAFQVSGVSGEDLGYLSLLCKMLGMVNTRHYNYADLANEINVVTGGINFGLNLYPKAGHDYAFTCEVRAKFLYEESAAAMKLIEEMILMSDFSDEKRLWELVQLNKSRLEMQMNSAGHLIASLRAMANFSKTSKISDEIGGVGFYQFLKDLEEHFDEKKGILQKKCEELMEQIFTSAHLVISSAGTPEAMVKVERDLLTLMANLPHTYHLEQEPQVSCRHAREAFKDASQIQYVCRAGNFADAGYSYTGTMRILRVILGYDYFWINVRVKGGAYGCMNQFARNGNMYFVSYRDPNLADTIDVFDKTPEYIRSFEADERDMTKYIIGTISEMDTPLTPSQRGLRALGAYFMGITDEDLQRERTQVITATAEDIRALAEPVEAALKQGVLCVVGNEDAIEKERDRFDKVTGLF